MDFERSRRAMIKALNEMDGSSMGEITFIGLQFYDDPDDDEDEIPNTVSILVRHTKGESNVEWSLEGLER